MKHQKLRVGFIGLGLMGLPMSTNIQKAGFALSVYNRTRAKTETLRKNGATVYDSPKELAKEVDILITMITGPRDVESVLTGKDGVATSGNKDLVVIDMSTIGPQAAKKIGRALQEKGISFLDAPVTGSTYKANTAELTIFIGGEKSVFEKVKPVLSAMGTNLQYIGKQGSGQAIKLVNNFLVASTVSALAESMLLADTLDLPRDKAAEALSDVPALSPFMKMKLPNLVNNQHPVAFSVANMRKDLHLAKDETTYKDPQESILSLVTKLYDKAFALNLGAEDISAVIEVIVNKEKK